LPTQFYSLFLNIPAINTIYHYEVILSRVLPLSLCWSFPWKPS